MRRDGAGHRETEWTEERQRLMEENSPKCLPNALVRNGVQYLGEVTVRKG